MTKSKHTPTPLSLPLKLTDSSIKRHNRISIVDAGGCHVADIQVNLEDANPTYTLAERQQYAAFIVKAVNNHQALIDALETATKRIDMFSRVDQKEILMTLAAAKGDA